MIAMSDDSEAIAVIGLYSPLVEEERAVNYGDVFAISHALDNVVLQWQRIYIPLSGGVQPFKHRQLPGSFSRH